MVAAAVVLALVVGAVVFLRDGGSGDDVATDTTSQAATTAEGEASTGSTTASTGKPEMITTTSGPATTAPTTQAPTTQAPTTEAPSTTPPPSSLAEGTPPDVQVLTVAGDPAARTGLEPGPGAAIDGVGPYLVGETVDDLQAPPGLRWELRLNGRSYDNFQCRIFTTNTEPRFPTTKDYGPLLAVVIGDRVAILEVLTDDVSTRSGIHVGSSTADVYSTYPDQITASGDVLRYRPRDPAEAAYGVNFLMEDDQVSAIDLGIVRYLDAPPASCL